ncbi:hypothetical protein [Mesorhizobium sp. NZP2077]|uniref:hypothetical protein n=1 Tax=Mesorhizobium sp. NZP2077 TaxID=2483404 RepID=UPI001555B7A1|nr:hypothetical protein [Mesorhizobium sp. NZP2077]QKD19219.1 hypothetical protein HGP13_31820 [Mesorhizobium sp. NZP2077]
MIKQQPKREVVDVHEEAVFAVENGIPLDQLRDLIRTLGKDRETAFLQLPELRPEGRPA